MSERVICHVLIENGASEPPFADRTRCGLRVGDKTSAMWSFDKLPKRDKFSPSGYRWCHRCVPSAKAHR